MHNYNDYNAGVDVELGQRRAWYKTKRTFVVESKAGETSSYICRYEDGEIRSE